MNLPENIIAKCHEFNKKSQSRYDYAILTEENGKVKFHDRAGEPCYGGLRKYKDDGPNVDCTDPNQHKPGDLKHKFPSGTPVGVSFKWSVNKQEEDLFFFLIGDTSPFIRAFGNSNNWIITRDNKDIITGAILTETDIDPTVLVNMAKFIRNSLHLVTKFKTLVNKGLSQEEAFVCISLDGTPSVGKPVFSNGYMFSIHSSPEMMMMGKTNDVTKGTFKNRYDYNRKKIQDIFNGEERKLPFAAELDRAINKKYTVDNYVKAAKEVLSKYKGEK